MDVADSSTDPEPKLQGREPVEKVKDLVCGMMVDPETAPAKSEFKGKEYHSCARGCKVAFDKDPEKYVARENDK